MSNPTTISPRARVAAAALACVAWAGGLLQLYLSLSLALAGGKGVVVGVAIYLGYFTVLTNLLVAVALTWPLLAPGSAPAKFFSRPAVLSGVATSIVFVGLSYHFLLRHVWNPQGLQLFADVLLHYAVPLLCALHWWAFVPKTELRWTDALRWCAYPIAYFASVLARGALFGSYPYHLINVHTLGWRQTLANAGGLLLAFVLLGLMLIAIGRGRIRQTNQ